MKKNKRKNQERKPRRLSLSRETIQVLDDPALLQQARAGFGDSSGPKCCQGTSDTHQLNDNGG